MHFRVTGDIDATSGIGEVIFKISGPTRQHFLMKDYGVGLNGVAVVLMCQDPKLDLKKRIKVDRKKRFLYIDIMLNLFEMQNATPQIRENIVSQRIGSEVPGVFKKYKFQDFDEGAFSDDLQHWFSSLTRKQTP